MLLFSHLLILLVFFTLLISYQVGISLSFLNLKVDVTLRSLPRDFYSFTQLELHLSILSLFLVLLFLYVLTPILYSSKLSLFYQVFPKRY